MLCYLCSVKALKCLKNLLESRWGSNLNEMSMKSTLPVRELYGMRSPPDMGIVGTRERYSKTRAPELNPLTICLQKEIEYLISD